MPRGALPKKMRSGGLSASTTFKFGKVKVGVVGFTTEATPQLLFPGRLGPFEVRPLVPAINAEAARLLSGDASREDWETFADRLDDWQSELIEYRRRWLASAHPADKACQAWSFQPPRQVALTLLDHWEEYSQIVAAD